MFQHCEKDAILPIVLAYGTTFGFESYVSTLVTINIEMKEHPLFPIAYFMHNRKRSADHNEFLSWAFKKLKINPNVPIVTDREAAIVNYFKSQNYQNNLFCANHFLRS